MENGDQPATRADLAQVRIDLRAEMKAMEDRLAETMRDVQTELLKAFYTYGQSTDLKLKESEIADFTIRQRLTSVEFRLTEVERRLNLPSGS